MKKISQDGMISGTAIALIGVCVLLVAAIIFGATSYSGEKKYKNNADQLIATAVTLANTKLAAQLNAKFQAENDATVTSYTGPSQYGSVTVYYPKSWSGYVDTAGSNPLDAYFNPGVVPSVNDQSSIFALRIEVVATAYNIQLAQYTSQQSNQQGPSLSITPFSLSNATDSSIVGVMINGLVRPSKQGVMVMFPLRTDTLEIWTESAQYTKLFTSQILQTATFQP